MKLDQHLYSENTSTLFVYGSFMFANIDYVGLLDYVIKAILGAVVWFAFKVIQEHYSAKLRKKVEGQTKEDQPKTNTKP